MNNPIINKDAVEINSGFGVTSQREKEIKEHIVDYLKVNNGGKWTKAIRDLWDDPFFRDDQERFFLLFELGVVQQFVINKIEEKYPTVASKVEAIVKNNPKLGKILKETIEDTNCGDPNCPVHGKLNKKKEPVIN